jgi:hypothetical protein
MVATRISLLSMVTLWATLLTAPEALAQQRMLVPVVSDGVLGAHSSVWHSELVLYNKGTSPQVVSIAAVYPAGGTTCAPLDPVTLPPDGEVIVRNFGCTGGAAALELEVPADVSVHSRIVNVKGLQDEDGCCLSGLATTVPVLPTTVYATTATLAAVPVPVAIDEGTTTSLNRNNLWIVNPNTDPIDVAFTYIVATGPDNGFVWDIDKLPYATVHVPARSSVQAVDATPLFHSMIGEGEQFSGVFRIVAAAGEPFFILDSDIDNATGDTTINLPE